MFSDLAMQFNKSLNLIKNYKYSNWKHVIERLINSNNP
jgi:hypothetical protein